MLREGRPFAHRIRFGKYESICPKCTQTVCSVDSEAEQDACEKAHVCDPLDLAIIASFLDGKLAS